MGSFIIQSMLHALGQLFHNLWFQLGFMVVLATVHGYAAAWIAIRMLFRPRYPVKIFGITVWPQGMIPRHRQRLAETIGRAVGNELVSQETVINALFEANFFQRKVEGFINAYTEELLGANYPSLVEALPSAARAPVLDAIAALQNHIADFIADLLKSEAVADAVRSFIDRRLDDLLAHRLGDAINDDAFAKIVRFVEDGMQSVVTAPDFERRLRTFVGARLDELLHSRATLAEIFTPDTVALVKDRIDEQVPPIVSQLAEIATSSRTRTQIGALIKREVDDYYEQLSFFKKIFISRERIHGEVDDLVNKTLPRRVAEFLHGEAFEQEAKHFLDTQIENVLARPINDLIGQLSPDKLELIKDQTTARLVALARNPEVAATVASYSSDALQRLRPHTVRALLQYVKPESAQRLKSALTKALLEVIGHEDTARALNRMLSGQIERLLIAPIGRPTDYLSSTSIERASRALAERINTAARERLPVAITEFDVGGIVRKKVSEYPVEKLEQLVLSVAAQHLRTIELFGLVMGFMIGVGQAAYFWFSLRHGR